MLPKPTIRTRRGPKMKNGAISSAQNMKPTDSRLEPRGSWCMYQLVQVGSGWVS